MQYNSISNFTHSISLWNDSSYEKPDILITSRPDFLNSLETIELNPDTFSFTKIEADFNLKITDFSKEFVNKINETILALENQCIDEKEIKILITELNQLSKILNIFQKKIDIVSIPTNSSVRKCCKNLNRVNFQLVRLAKYFVNNFPKRIKTSLVFEIVKFCTAITPNLSLKLTKSLYKNLGEEDFNQNFLALFKIIGDVSRVKCLAWLQDVKNVLKNVKKIQITDQDQLFEIAKLCAKYNGTDTAESIQKFGIKNKNQLFDILQICLQHSPTEIDRFKIFEPFKEIFEELFDYSCFMELDLFTGDPFRYPQELISESFYHAEKMLSVNIQKKFSESSFSKILENVGNIPDEYTKYQNLLSLANAIIIFNMFKHLGQLNNDHILWLDQHGLIEGIANFKNLSLRFSLYCLSASVASVKEYREAFEGLNSPQIDPSNKCWQKLTRFLLAVFVSQGINVNSFMEKIEMLVCFKKNENAQALIEMLILLLQDTELLAEEKKQLLDRIINEVPKVEGSSIGSYGLESSYLQNIHSVISLFNFDESDQLKDISTTLVKVSENILKINFFCQNVDDFANKYIKKFSECRNSSAIITYSAKIDSLAHKQASNCLKDYIVSVLNDTFIDDRYSLTNNFHLQKINGYKSTLLKDWRANQPAILMKIFDDLFISSQKLHAKEWMRIKLILGKRIDLERFELNYLIKYIKENDSQALLKIETDLNNEIKNALKDRNKAIREEALISEIIQILEMFDENSEIEIFPLAKDQETGLKDVQLKFKKLKKNIPILSQTISEKNTSKEVIAVLKECNESLKTTKEIYNQLKFQSLCIKWIRGRENLQRILEERIKLEPSINKKMYDTLSDSYYSNYIYLKNNCLNEIKEILIDSPFNNPLFVNDIQAKIDEKNELETRSNEVAIETDDPIDLMLCGHEVGSCLKVDGHSIMTRGLLGYLMDGKIKMLAIKSEEGPNGRIIARCMLRLLWDGEKPVLLLDKPYPLNGVSEKREEVLKTLARNKAKTLGLPLLSLTGKGKLYNNDYWSSLMALGGPVPAEYCDSKGGVTNGKYFIHEARYLD